MTTAALTKKYRQIKDFSERIEMPNGRNAKSLIKFVCISTDKKSVREATRMLDHLEDIQAALLNENNKKELASLKTMLNTTNENLVKVNSFFHFVNKVMEQDGDTTKVSLDEKNMLHFLATMQKCKRIMEHISNYLQLVVEVQQEGGKGKLYSVDDLFKEINQAV